jgi:hypothetical protein
MKTALVLIALSLSGCISGPPLDFEQRMAVVQMMQSQRYVLPAPQQLTVPQQHTIYCRDGGNTVVCQ